MQTADYSLTKSVLLVAAESIVLSSGTHETVADVVFHRALKHYHEGLRQYFAIRLRSSSAADQALTALRARLSGWSAEALCKKPGPRAHLYKLAREITAERRIRTIGARTELAYLPPADNAPGGYVAALARVRKELSAEDTELLELRYARELTPRGAGARDRLQRRGRHHAARALCRPRRRHPGQHAAEPPRWAARCAAGGVCTGASQRARLSGGGSARAASRDADLASATPSRSVSARARSATSTGRSTRTCRATWWR